MASGVAHAERFSSNLKDLCELTVDTLNFLISKGYTDVPNPTLMTLASLFVNSFNDNAKIEKFIERSNEHWDKIRQCDESFFIENARDIFADKVSMENIDMFSSIFKLKNPKGEFAVTKDTRESFWEFFHALVKISIRYIHQERNPYKLVFGDEIVEEYEYEFVDHIDLKHHSGNWGVTLEFPLKESDA